MFLLITPHTTTGQRRIYIYTEKNIVTMPQSLPCAVQLHADDQVLDAVQLSIRNDAVKNLQHRLSQH